MPPSSPHRGFNWLEKTVSALAYTVCETLDRSGAEQGMERGNVAARFVLRQMSAMPDYLRWPMVMATLVFGLSGLVFGGRLFHQLDPARRRRQVAWWSVAPFGPCRDLIKFHQSLATLAAHEPEGARRGLASGIPGRFFIGTPQANRMEVAVVGSGPGGAITACLAAEAGRRVTLFEEGADWAAGSCRPFSLEEMLQKYRNGGVNVAMGRSKIAYVEGRCVGGGSEINSGLYHRTPPEVLEQWRREYQVEGLDDAGLVEHFEACERDVSVGLLRGPAPPASLRLHEGAQRLGWKSMEVPRWFAYESGAAGAAGGGQRQSMSRTYIPRALQAGCDLRTRTRIVRLRRDGSGWKLEGRGPAGERGEWWADTVFVAAGAVQTPALLLRSGIDVGGLVGRSLRLHPTIKVIAEFPEAVNFDGMGVPVHQVKEFSPLVSLGCSISSRPFLAVGMLDHPDRFRNVLERWQRMAVYYAMITPRGSGVVRPLPGFGDPLVQYRLTPEDYRALADGLGHLNEALLAAGAVQLLPSIRGGAPVGLGARSVLGELPVRDTNLMTIHLFSSVPMGENRQRCGADSFGRVHGVPNLYVNDASLLCTAPGVNPQGSIMAIARRNALKFLGKRG